MDEMNISSKILRDLFDEKFTSILVNDEALQIQIKDYVQKIAPKKESIVKLYKSKIPIFEKYGIERQIKTSFGKNVSMTKGSYLVIEHTEALHVIDVNSGNRSSSSKNQEESALEVNLTAATEIARQLRLRDMGGIIVIDFIDQNTSENRRKLFNHLKSEMQEDRAKHKILPPSKFGLIQITRQRVRPEMNIKTREQILVEEKMKLKLQLFWLIKFQKMLKDWLIRERKILTLTYIHLLQHTLKKDTLQ